MAQLKLEVVRDLLCGAKEFEVRRLLDEVHRDALERINSAPGSSEAWLRQLANLLAEHDAKAAPSQQAETLVLLGVWFEDSDNRYAIRLLSRAHEIASMAGTLALKRRVLNALGGVHTRARNTAEATICYAEALSIAEQLGDRIGRCAVIANMATLRLNMGMLDDAIKLASFVCELCGSESLLRLLKMQAHHVSSEAFLALSNSSAALMHARAALGCLSEPGTRIEAAQRVLVEACMVRACVAANQLSQAEQHKERAVQYAAVAGTRSARIQAQLSVALCEAARGDTDVSLTRLALIESEVGPTDMSFTDLLEVELIANRRAGRQQYADYYNKKYLFCLAEFQRKGAIEQVANIKRLLKRAERIESTPVVCDEQAFDSNSFPQALFQQINALASLAELRQDPSGEHSCRVATLARLLALRIGYTESNAALIATAASLHDIGKLATPDAILLKHGKFSSVEQEIMRRHSTEGCQILTDLLYTVEATALKHSNEIATALRVAAEVAQHHHEKWNGTGYPRRIAGSMIPESARIVALADVFDELTHARPYKRQYSKSESLAQIEKLAGQHFDPGLCSAFLSLLGEMSDEPPAALKLEMSSRFASANGVIGRIVASTSNMKHAAVL